MSRFVHSFSATKKFKQCADLFHKDRVLRLYPFVQGEAAKRGDAVHLAMANFISRSILMPPELEGLLELAKAVKAAPGKKFVEQKLGVTKDFRPCEYFDDEVYSRCVIDYLRIEPCGTVAVVLDWKTGKDSYPDVDQLLENAVTVFAHYPEVQRIKARLVFVDHDTSVPAEFDREYLSDYQDQMMADCAEIDLAMANEDYPLKKGPLCPWCPVTDCPNWTPPRKK